jgi:hypothetical protein
MQDAGRPRSEPVSERAAVASLLSDATDSRESDSYAGKIPAQADIHFLSPLVEARQA